eukprot:scaffold1514_cov303-Pavlova_lutheri.AAC.1
MERKTVRTVAWTRVDAGLSLHAPGTSVEKVRGLRPTAPSQRMFIERRVVDTLHYNKGAAANRLPLECLYLSRRTVSQLSSPCRRLRLVPL